MASDSNYADVVLLLPFDGTDGSTTITDSSPVENDILVFGGAHISTTRSKFGGASLALDGTGDYLMVPDSADIRITGGDFTIEMWVYRTSSSTQSILLQKGVSILTSEFTMYLDTSGNIVFSIGADPDLTILTSSGATVPLNTWTYLTVVKSASNIHMFVDGVLLTTDTLTTATTTNTDVLYIGRTPVTGGLDWPGYIDDLRITTIARYTSTFSVPTEAHYIPPPPEVVVGENAVVGSMFETTPVISWAVDPSASVLGRPFGSKPSVLGGATVAGGPFTSTPAINYATDNTAYITGGTLVTTALISAESHAVGSLRGRGFGSQASIQGGAVVKGSAFSTAFASTATANAKAAVTGRGFATTPTISAVSASISVVIGNGFSSGLYYSRIVGSSFATAPIIRTAFDTAYAEAYVMNIKTNAVSRYQNFPFTHVGRVGDKFYGFGAAGIYELTGTTDGDTSVNGTIHTATLDFGVFNSKNVPYMYINGDDEYTITGYVDDEEQPPFISGFSGRRVKLARGNKGRYWAFKIEGVSKLQGLEFMPDQLSRRVK